MSFRDHLEIRDPAIMRALAHPVRLAIIQRLYVRPATATECSDAVDESPSACSYHLRKLADFGLVEETDAVDGRERRWKMKVTGWSVDLDDTSAGRAARSLLIGQSIARSNSALDEYLRNEASFSHEWQEAAILSHNTLWMTADELKRLRQLIDNFLEPYVERVEPDRRPHDSERVEVHLRAFPRPAAPEYNGNGR